MLRGKGTAADVALATGRRHRTQLGPEGAPLAHVIATRDGGFNLHVQQSDAVELAHTLSVWRTLAAGAQHALHAGDHLRVAGAEYVCLLPGLPPGRTERPPVLSGDMHSEWPMSTQQNATAPPSDVEVLAVRVHGASEASEYEVFEFFSQAGVVADMQLHTRHGVTDAFWEIEFVATEAVERALALDGAQLGEQTLRIYGGNLRFVRRWPSIDGESLVERMSCLELRLLELLAAAAPDLRIYGAALRDAYAAHFGEPLDAHAIAKMDLQVHKKPTKALQSLLLRRNLLPRIGVRGGAGDWYVYEVVVENTAALEETEERIRQLFALVKHPGLIDGATLEPLYGDVHKQALDRRRFSCRSLKELLLKMPRLALVFKGDKMYVRPAEGLEAFAREQDAGCDTSRKRSRSEAKDQLQKNKKSKSEGEEVSSVRCPVCRRMFGSTSAYGTCERRLFNHLRDKVDEVYIAWWDRTGGATWDINTERLTLPNPLLPTKPKQAKKSKKSKQKCGMCKFVGSAAALLDHQWHKQDEQHKAWRAAQEDDTPNEFEVPREAALREREQRQPPGPQPREPSEGAASTIKPCSNATQQFGCDGSESEPYDAD